MSLDLGSKGLFMGRDPARKRWVAGEGLLLAIPSSSQSEAASIMISQRVGAYRG